MKKQDRMAARVAHAYDRALVENALCAEAPQPAAIRKLIRADGTEETLAGVVPLERVRRLVGAATLDVVLLADRKHVMLVDDNGYSKGLPVNSAATRLYHQVCKPGTTHQILGDVVVVPDADYGSQP